jgi:hypothetical protein
MDGRWRRFGSDQHRHPVTEIAMPTTGFFFDELDV